MRQILMTKAAIAKNKATTSLAELVAKDGASFGASLPAKLTAKPKAGNEILIYRKDGIQKAIEVPKSFADAWKTSDPQMSAEAMKFIRHATGTSFVKFLATSGNPEFAVANIMRDLGFTYLSSKEYSPVLPMAVVQQMRNLGKQIISKETRRVLAELYKRHGGSTDYLSSMDHLNDLHNPGAVTVGRQAVNKVIKALGYFGNLSEETVRLAHMQQALRNAGVKDFSEANLRRLAVSDIDKIEKAVFAASNVLDFRQGGNIAKIIDTAVPFFNPSIQGARGVLRAFKERPAETAFRASQIMALGAYIAWYNRKNNEKAWDSVSDVEKDTKAVVTLPVSRTDANGNERHIYLAPALDQGWRPFFILGQMISEKNMGKDVNPQRLINSIKSNYVPYDAANLPPVVAALLTYSQNHDFWRNEKVWRGRDVSPEMERKANTPEIYNAAGDLTGLSPERLRAAMAKLVPDNPVSYTAGVAMDKLLGSKGKEDMAIEWAKAPGVRKMMRLTSARDITSDDLKAAKRLGVPAKGKAPASVLNEIEAREKEVNTQRQKNDVALQKIAAQVKSGVMQKADIYKAAWQLVDEKGKRGKERGRALRALKQRYPDLRIIAPSEN
jgi:hypothetical protein